MATTALIISTYNRPTALYLTLLSVLQQKTMPTEIIIADDGSTQSTKEVVDFFIHQKKLSIKHVWHNDDGFRLSAIRNKAIAASVSEYIIQTDGDLILHPYFVQDHMQFAKPNSFVTASRVLINEEKTKGLEESKSIFISLFSAYIKDKGNGFHLPFLWKLFESYKRHKEPAKVRGCNMAFWRKDVINVNGYDESFTGWGHEDMELAQRFLNNGLIKRFLKFGAVQYHLYHPEASRNNDRMNKEKFFETERTNKKKCEIGLQQYL
jgi:glycosyltransferase involved in cell wall biosynthesis